MVKELLNSNANKLDSPVIALARMNGSAPQSFDYLG